MKHYAVEWAFVARDDVEDIADYILAKDSAINALKAVERIEARVATLITLPMRGRIVPELQRQGVTAFQELIERPWRIIYQINAYRVVIVSVLDGRRNLEDLLLSRFLR